MPKLQNVKKVLVIGSGPIIIGQAAEFDYSGTQACRALKEEGLEVVLVNSNPATIMTDVHIADRVYVEPVNVEFLESVIKRERPDALLATLGGQVGLNLAIDLDKQGILREYNVKLLGTQIESIKRAEDRELFKETMEKINQPIPESTIVETVSAAKEFAREVGYPLIVRPAYTLGGTGGGIANNDEELDDIVSKGLLYSLIGQALIERSVAGWKEIEYEVLRDADDNCITVCSMENLDPVGVHTGDRLQIRTKEQNAIVSRFPSEIFPEYILIRGNEFDKVAVTPLDEWMRYLKDGIIASDTTAPGLEEAREKLKYYSMTDQERHAYDEHLNAVMIQNDVLNTAKMEGRMEGRMEGLMEGRMEERLANARNFKKMGVSPDIIAQATGLSLEEINGL